MDGANHVEVLNANSPSRSVLPSTFIYTRVTLKETSRGITAPASATRHGRLMNQVHASQYADNA